MVLLPDIDTYYDLLKHGITLNVVYVYLIQGTLVTLLSQVFPPLVLSCHLIIHLSIFSLSLMSVTCRWYILTFWLAPWPNVSSGITGTGMIFTMVALANWSKHWISTNQLPFGNTFWCLWNLLDILVHYAAACMRVTQPMSKMDDTHHTTAHLIGDTALLFVPQGSNEMKTLHLVIGFNPWLIFGPLPNFCWFLIGQ